MLAINRSGRNPHGPSQPNPGDPVFMEIEVNDPDLPKLELPWAHDAATADGQTVPAFLTDFNFVYVHTKAYIQRQWHRVYKLSSHSLKVSDVRLLVARAQEPSYFEAGHESAHDWLKAIRAVKRPVVAPGGFLLRLPRPSEPPVDIPLRMELVPETAWWSNLRSNLPGKDWQKLRKVALAAASDECEICRFRNPKRAPDVHEEWAYDEENSIQRLTRLICLCTWCHAAKHYGRTCAIGDKAVVDAHICKVNRWSQAQLDAYAGEQMREWERRSQREWLIDFKVIEELGVAVPAELDRRAA